MYYVYVLRSVSDDGLYIGYSANLRKRFDQHAQGAFICNFVPRSLETDLLRGLS